MRKYLKVMLILVVALSLLGTVAFATNTNPFVVNGSATVGNAGRAMNNIGATAVELIRIFGGILAIIMVLITGIQYLIGTPAKKQEIKGK